jgi:hypothetical protein
MKRILAVWCICIGTIVLTNCQDTGGTYSRTSPRTSSSLNWPAPAKPFDVTEVWDEMARERMVREWEPRTKKLEAAVKELAQQVQTLEARVATLESEAE